MNKKRVIILFGGETRESLVSVASAQNCAAHIENPICWFWAKNGNVHVVSKEMLMAHKNPFEIPFEARTKPDWDNLQTALAWVTPEIHTFLINLHGGMGENGTVQTWLENKDISFVGSDSACSHNAFNKMLAKKIIEQAGLKTAIGTAIESKQDLIDFYAKYPKIILKPVEDGSSFGLHFIRSDSDYEDLLRSFNFPPKQKYMAEVLLDGLELTVAVIDDKNGPLALPVIEIRKEAGRDFDFAGKYHADGVAEICPAEISGQLAEKSKKFAIKVYKVLKAFGHARVDIIVCENECYFIELNTLPGVTQESLIPKALKAEGIGMEEFLSDQVAMAQKREKWI